jgi:F-type H+-transporting ATPase subunit epsilon
MSLNAIAAKVLSPERILFRGEARSVNLPGALGYMAILPGHAPMVAELTSGIVKLVPTDENIPVDQYFISGGFVDVSKDGITVLADVVEKYTEINLDRAKKSLKRADERLDSQKSGNVDVSRALSSKKRAINRIQLALDSDSQK